MSEAIVYDWCASCNYLEAVAVSDFRRDDSDIEEKLCAECAERLGVIVNDACTCNELDDDLIEAGYTCYSCYEFRKDNPSATN